MTLRLTGLLAMLVLLAGAQDAAAALRKIEQAYELDLAQVTLPAVAGRSLTLRRCASCAPELLRLDAQAMFQVLPGTGSVSLDTLRREAARLSHRPRTSLFVYFDPRSAIVRRIVLDATQ